jgi:chemotaxis response regulator CheB
MLPIRGLVFDDSVVIRELRSEALALNEPLSVARGMPRAVVSSEPADKICPLNEISKEVIARMQANRIPHLPTSARELT